MQVCTFPHNITGILGRCMHGRTRCLVLEQFRCYRQDPSGVRRGELSDLLWQGQIPALCKESGHEKVGLSHTEGLFKTLLTVSLRLPTAVLFSRRHSCLHGNVGWVSRDDIWQSKTFRTEWLCKSLVKDKN